MMSMLEKLPEFMICEIIPFGFVIYVVNER